MMLNLSYPVCFDFSFLPSHRQYLQTMQNTERMAIWKDNSSWVIANNLPVSVSAEYFTGSQISSLHILLSKDSGGLRAQ